MKPYLKNRTDGSPPLQIFKTAGLALLCLFMLTPSLAAAVTIGERLCRDTLHYDCYKVKRGDTWKKLFPDSHAQDVVMRVNRMNIALYAGLRIAIPKSSLNRSVLDFSPFPEQITPPGKKMIYVSLHPDVLAFGAYSHTGQLLRWGPVSGARGYCHDIGRSCHTALGTFTLYRKGGKGCVSSKFPVPRGGAPMPWCMFFHGGFALHGSYEVPGFNASHGCIRLMIPDAEWLNQSFSSRDDPVVVIITQKK